jgi:hypothetical protein
MRTELTELLDVTGPAFGILLELLIELGAFMLQELLDSVTRLGVFPRCLERLESGQVLLARLLEVRDGELGQLVLVGIGDAALFGLLLLVGSFHNVVMRLETVADGWLWKLREKFRDGARSGR